MNLSLRKKAVTLLSIFALFTSGITSCSQGVKEEENMEFRDEKIEKLDIFEEGHLRLFGRTGIENVEDKKSILFSWSSTGFELFLEAKEDSNEIKVELFSTIEGHDHQYVKVYLDGEEKEVFELAKGRQEITLVSNVKKGSHTLKFVKMNEASTTRLNLISLNHKGFDFYKRNYLKPRNYIEFYGDSLTAGYGNIGTPDSKTYYTKEQDSTKTYAQIVADKLDYDASLIAWSGIALTETFAPYGVHMMNKYDTVDGVKKYEMSNIKPKIVVINLGSNDHGGYSAETMTIDKREAGLKEFVEDYSIIVDKIKSYAPEAKVISCYNMCFSISTKLIKAIKDSTKNINEKYGEGTAYALAFQGNQSGANGHPSYIAHEAAATKLYNFIEEKELNK